MVKSKKPSTPPSGRLPAIAETDLLRVLIPASFIYLALPSAVFCLGWLKGIVGIPLFALLAAGSIVSARGALRRLWANPGPKGWSLTIPVLLATIAVLAMLLSISGLAGWGVPDDDGVKHDALLRGLIERPWPVSFMVQGVPTLLTYYTAYYLPAALVGKLAGWAACNAFLLLWDLIGLSLAALWFMVLARTRGLWAPLAFAMMSGLDGIGTLIYHPTSRWTYIEIWGYDCQYFSAIANIFWVPQHAIGGWILTGLFMGLVGVGFAFESAVLLWGLSLLWSPFASLGLLPFLIAHFCADKGWRRLNRTSLVTLPHIAGLAMILLYGLYYASKVTDPHLPYIDQQDKLTLLPLDAARQGAKEFVKVLTMVPFFCVLEFGLYAFAVSRCKRGWTLGHRKAVWAGIATLASLCILPLFHYGFFNDLASRASIPALFVLWIFVGRALFSRDTTPGWRTVLLVLLVLGALTPGVEIRRHLQGIQERKRWIQVPRIEEVQDLPTLQKTYAHDAFPFVLQYIGSPNSIFFKGLSKKPVFEEGGPTGQ